MAGTVIDIIEARPEHSGAITQLWAEMMYFHVALNSFYTDREDAPERAEEFLRTNIERLAEFLAPGATGEPKVARVLRTTGKLRFAGATQILIIRGTPKGRDGFSHQAILIP